MERIKNNLLIVLVKHSSVQKICSKAGSQIVSYLLKAKEIIIETMPIKL